MPRRFVSRLLFAALAVGGTLSVSAPASACQLVCVGTKATYNGNLGGVSGADAKCAAEFSGFKFARSSSFMANMVQSGVNASSSAMSWAQSFTLSTATTQFWVNAIPGSTNSCSDWASDSGTGTIVQMSYNTYNTQEGGCGIARALLCCNM